MTIFYILICWKENQGHNTFDMMCIDVCKDSYVVYVCVFDRVGKLESMRIMQINAM